MIRINKIKYNSEKFKMHFRQNLDKMDTIQTYFRQKLDQNLYNLAISQTKFRQNLDKFRQVQNLFGIDTV